MSKPRPKKPTPPPIPSGSLRVWWDPPDRVRKFIVPVATIQQAQTVLRTLAEYDEFRRDGIGCGGLEVFRDDDWSKWYNADGNDIRWVMAQAEAVAAEENGDPPDRRDRPRWRP